MLLVPRIMNEQRESEFSEILQFQPLPAYATMQETIVEDCPANELPLSHFSGVAKVEGKENAFVFQHRENAQKNYECQFEC